MYDVTSDYLSKVYTSKHILKVYYTYDDSDSESIVTETAEQEIVTEEDENSLVTELAMSTIEIPQKYILSCSVSHDLSTNDEFLLGTTTSKQIDLKIHKNGYKEDFKQIKIVTGIENNEFNLGYFNADTVQNNDDDTVSFTLYDNMIKFEFNYDGSELIAKKGSSVTLREIVEDICSKAGVEFNTSAFTNEDTLISVYDSTITARTYLGYIAEMAGCFALIDRDGKLIFKSVSTTAVATIEDNYLQDYKFGDEMLISRVYYENGIESWGKGTVANDTYYVDPNNLYCVEENEITKLYELINGLALYSFECETIIDPAIDIGDTVQTLDKLFLFQGSIEYKGKWKAKITSSIMSTEKSETTTRKVSNKTAIRRIQSQVDEEAGKIELLAEEVSDTQSDVSDLTIEVDEISSKVSTIADITNEVTGTNPLKLENCMEGELQELHIYGNNSVFSSSEEETTGTQQSAYVDENGVYQNISSTDYVCKVYETSENTKYRITQNAGAIYQISQFSVDPTTYSGEEDLTADETELIDSSDEETERTITVNYPYLVITCYYDEYEIAINSINVYKIIQSSQIQVYSENLRNSATKVEGRFTFKVNQSTDETTGETYYYWVIYKIDSTPSGSYQYYYYMGLEKNTTYFINLGASEDNEVYVGLFSNIKTASEVSNQYLGYRLKDSDSNWYNDTESMNKNISFTTGDSDIYLALWSEDESLLTNVVVRKYLQTYDIGVDEVLRSYSDDVRDEFVYQAVPDKDTNNNDLPKGKIIRRVGVDDDGNLYELPTEVVTYIDEEDILLIKDTNYIDIVSYTAGMKAKFIIQNDFTNIFSTTYEVTSAIEQLANEINLIVTQKVDKGSVTAQLNLEVSDEGAIVTINGNKFILTTDTVTIDENGKMVISATSTEPYQYSYIDFLLAMRHITGNITLPEDIVKAYSKTGATTITELDAIAIKNQVEGTEDFQKVVPMNIKLDASSSHPISIEYGDTSSYIGFTESNSYVQKCSHLYVGKAYATDDGAEFYGFYIDGVNRVFKIQDENGEVETSIEPRFINNRLSKKWTHSKFNGI